MKEKYCKKCDTVKPIEEFHKHKLVGHETYCKTCQNENSRRNAKNAMYVNGKRIPVREYLSLTPCTNPDDTRRLRMRPLVVLRSTN
jgi:hypothetical protein